MRTVLLILFAITLQIKASRSQPWSKVADFAATLTEPPTYVYSDTQTNSLFISGRFTWINGFPYFGIAQYYPDSIYNLSCGISWNCDTLMTVTGVLYGNCVIRYNSNIFITGKFEKVGNLSARSIGKWNGQTWNQIGTGLSRGSLSVGLGLTLKEIDNDLYVGGIFDSAFGLQVNSLVKYDGQNWADVSGFPLYAPPGGSLNQVNQIVKFQDQLYVSGHFYSGFNLTDINNIVTFDGANWLRVGNGITTPNEFIYDMVVYKNQLIVAGQFSKNSNPNNPGNNIAAWDGLQWNSLGDASQNYGITGSANASVTGLVVRGDYLYVCGNFTNAGGIPATNVARWDGNNWCSLATGFNSPISNEIINSIAFYGDTLFAVGQFFSYNGDSTIRYAAKLANPDSYTINCSSIGVKEMRVLHLTLSPNPCTTILTVSSVETPFQYQFYNLHGQEIISGTSNAKQLDVTALKPGMYFLKVKDRTGARTAKVVNVEP